MPRKFRTDISFLRAISVTIVLLFHFEVAGFSGGFIGVDVFNVISGFLMTMIILRGFENDTYSLKGFYNRRIRRLVPALSTLLLFVIIISAIFFSTRDFKHSAGYVTLANFFVSNIYFWKYQNYFASTDNILLHSWSLGVEWQFYVIYPLILMACRKIYFKHRKLFWGILTAITLLSFSTLFFMGGGDPNFTFYMLPARYWELSLGGLAFGLGTYWKPSRRTKFLIVIPAIIVIILSNFLINPTNNWPSIITLFPVVSVALILVSDLDLKFFDWRPIRLLGDTSYSLYLWHWPWFIFFKYYGLISPIYIVIVTILSILSAYLSYKYIEVNPFFKNPKFSISSTLVIGAMAFFLFKRPGYVRPISLTNGEKFSLLNFRGDYSATGQRGKQFNTSGCYVASYRNFKDYNSENCLTFSKTKPNILLMGDSHAAHFSPALRQLEDYNIMEATASFALPILNTRGRKDAKMINDLMFSDFIPKEKENIDLVLVSAYWILGRNAINYSKDELLKKIKETAEYFEKQGVDYLIIGQTEVYKIEFPKVLMFHNIFGRDMEQYKNKEASDINKALVELLGSDHYFDIYDSSEIDYIDEDHRTPYMFDLHHYTMYGAEQVVQKLIKQKLQTVLNQD